MENEITMVTNEEVVMLAKHCHVGEIEWDYRGKEQRGGDNGQTLSCWWNGIKNAQEI